MSKLELVGLQAEVGSWAQRNFGAQLPYRPALGTIEELCELGLAMLAGPLQENGNSEAIEDAIGDVAIYLLHKCHLRNWSFLDLHERARLVRCSGDPQPFEYVSKLDSPAGVLPFTFFMLSALMDISRYQLKGEQGIRGGSVANDQHLMATYVKVLVFLMGVSEALNKTFDDILLATWGRVCRRDWVANPDTAAAVAAEKVGGS